MSGAASTNDEIISVGDPLPTLSEAMPLDGRKVRIVWDSGKSRIVDLTAALASRRIYIPLRTDDELFRTLQVSEYGDAIEWSNGLDFSALWLDRLPSVEFDNGEFREAMTKLTLSLDGMAAELGISRRLVADFRRDKPIPRHIALAVRYLLQNRAA